MNSGTTSYIIMMVAMLLAMYLLVIRPQQKQEKETKEMRDSVKVGDEIVTIGGFYGKVVRVGEEKLIIQAGADKTRLEMAKWGVSKIVKAAEDEKVQVKKVTSKNIKKLGQKEEQEPEEPEEVKAE